LDSFVTKKDKHKSKLY